MENQGTGFKELLSSMMQRRWLLSTIVLFGFMVIMAGIFGAILGEASIAGEWKELLLLLLGAFIGSYGKIIDYWFSDTDKDKMMVQKMDEEDGISISSTSDIPPSNNPSTPIIPKTFTDAMENEEVFIPRSKKTKEKVEIDEDGDGVSDGYDVDGDGTIDEYFPHRQCQHVWGDENNDGEMECLVCGLLKKDE